MTEFLKWTDSGGSEKALEGEFVIPDWKDTRSGEVSTVPIEDGSEVADHYVQKPDALQVTVKVTNQPMRETACGVAWEQITLDVRKSGYSPHGLLFLTEAVGSAITSLLGAATGETKVWIRRPKEGRDFIGDFHDALVKIKETVSLCSITYRGRTVTSLVLETVDLSFGTDDTCGTFTLQFKRIKKVATKSATLPSPAGLLAKAAKVKLPVPKTATADEADALTYSKQSFFAAALGMLGAP